MFLTVGGVQEALGRGETDWARVEEELEMADPCAEDRGGFEEGDPPPIIT